MSAMHRALSIIVFFCPLYGMEIILNNKKLILYSGQICTEYILIGRDNTINSFSGSTDDFCSIIANAHLILTAEAQQELCKNKIFTADLRNNTLKVFGSKNAHDNGWTERLIGGSNYSLKKTIPLFAEKPRKPYLVLVHKQNAQEYSSRFDSNKALLLMECIKNTKDVVSI